MRASKYAWEKNNPDKVRLQRQRVRAKQKKWLNQLKDQPCLDCHQTYPPECMDFDHVRGQKKFGLASHSRSITARLQEIAKCELVCANCHRIRTNRRYQEVNMTSKRMSPKWTRHAAPDPSPVEGVDNLPLPMGVNRWALDQADAAAEATPGAMGQKNGSPSSDGDNPKIADVSAFATGKDGRNFDGAGSSNSNPNPAKPGAGS